MVLPALRMSRVHCVARRVLHPMELGAIKVMCANPVFAPQDSAPEAAKAASSAQTTSSVPNSPTVGFASPPASRAMIALPSRSVTQTSQMDRSAIGGAPMRPALPAPKIETVVRDIAMATDASQIAETTQTAPVKTDAYPSVG